MKPLRSARIFVLAAALNLWGPGFAAHAAMKLSLRSDYPGGNVVIGAEEGNVIHIAPDNRTSTVPWFYWNFAAEASEPGRAEFVFEGVKIGIRGPAVSLDGGKTWKWLGADHVTYSKPGEKRESFFYNFTKAGEAVRFAFCVPYLEENLNAFLKANAGNAHLSQSVLTKSNGGLPVELLQIGKAGEGKTAVLATARSHACEALASYVLEGFLREAMSDSPFGKQFREKYVLYSIPFLDKDGVQAGDQGKNRAPHDHNRDYGSTHLYPEIQAVQELAEKKGVKVTFDFHCPAARGDIHDAFHWMGLKIPPITENLAELTSWLDEERPASTNLPATILKAPSDPPKLENIPASWYFGQQKDILLAITLESPYAQVETMDEARAYGSAVLRALVRTPLKSSPAEGGEPGADGYAAFKQLKKELIPTGRSDVIDAKAREILDNAGADPVHRTQANLVMALARQRLRQFAEALPYATAAAAEPMATRSQKIQAHVAMVTIQARDPQASEEGIATALKQFEAIPFSSSVDSMAVYDALSTRYEASGDLPKALEFAQKSVNAAKLSREKSAALTRKALLLDKMGQSQDATATRKEVIDLLRPEILPKPNGKSIMLGRMTVEFFDAVNAIPSSTLEEKKQAAQIVLDYPTLPQDERNRVKEWMTQNGGGAN